MTNVGIDNLAHLFYVSQQTLTTSCYNCLAWSFLNGQCFIFFVSENAFSSDFFGIFVVVSDRKKATVTSCKTLWAILKANRH